MDSSTVQRLPSLSSQVLELLMEKIRCGDYPPESLLPPENVLAAEFKVSRATIRSAFDRLEARGLIVRRQGIGTFVRHISSIANPLNQFLDFFDLISQNGYQPEMIQLEAALSEPTLEIARDLQLNPEDQVLRVDKLFLADGNPIIYCTNNIPCWVFKDIISPDEALEPGTTEPFLEFFEKKCNQPIAYYVATVKVDLLRDCCSQKLFQKMDPLTPVLVINDIGYNSHERPIHQSIEYHPGNRMDFKLIRSR